MLPFQKEKGNNTATFDGKGEPMTIDELIPGEKLIILGAQGEIPAGTVCTFVEACANLDWIAVAIDGHPYNISIRLSDVRRYTRMV